MKIRRDVLMQKESGAPSGGVSPSAPDYHFNVADLQTADIGVEALGKIILANPQTPDNTALLAALLKNQFKKNSAYRPRAFAYAPFTVQQILTQNVMRNVLLIQNSGPNDILVVFEGNNPMAVDMSAAVNQPQLNQLQTRALRIVSGGSFTPFTPPSNPVTLFTLSGATFGLVIEGA